MPLAFPPAAGRRSHVTLPRPARPPRRPRPPRGRLPKSGGSERASRRARRREGGSAPEGGGAGVQGPGWLLARRSGANVRAGARRGRLGARKAACTSAWARVAPKALGVGRAQGAAGPSEAWRAQGWPVVDEIRSPGEPRCGWVECPPVGTPSGPRAAECEEGGAGPGLAEARGARSVGDAGGRGPACCPWLQVCSWATRLHQGTDAALGGPQVCSLFPQPDLFLGVP